MRSDAAKPLPGPVSLRDLLLIGAIGLFWGLNWPAVKIILAEIPPWTLRAIGLGTGALLLAALTRARGERLAVPRREIPALAAAGLFTVLGFNLFTAFGQLLSETSRAAIIAFTMPVWAVVLSIVFLGERLTRGCALAILLGLCALGLLAAEDPAALIARPAGTLFMLGAAVSWALGTVILKGAAPAVTPLARATWMLGISALPVLTGALVLERPWSLPVPSAGVLLVLGYHILFPMVVCHAAWVTLVARQPVSVAAIGTLIIPVVGVLSAALFLGDALGPERLLALGLVLLAILLALRG